MPFRAYTTQEVRDAAKAYGVDPDFAEAVYAVESSRGTNPKAMTARSVKRKRDSTIVRGPFQLEDDTTADLIRKNNLGNVNVDDPDAHLDLAMRLMRELKDTYNGDYNKVARAYLGGAGGVADQSLKDELGTSTGAYGNKIVAEMDRLKGGAPSGGPAYADSGGPELPESTRLALDAAAQPAGDDVFGIPATQHTDPNRVSWADLVAANKGPAASEFSLPQGVPDLAPSANEEDFNAYLTQLVNESFRTRGANA